MGTERVLILLNNTSRGAVRKKAVLLNSQVVSKFSFESSLNLPLYLVRVGDHAVNELPVLQNMESCGRKIGIHKKHKTK